jgi:hypothetical protein
MGVRVPPGARISPAAESAAERPKLGRPSSTLGGETAARRTKDVRLPPDQTVASPSLAEPAPVFRGGLVPNPF